MTDPRQPNFFFKTINGTSRKFKHTCRHGANSRKIAMVKFFEHIGLTEVDSFPDLKIVFSTAYNMGYKEGCKRTTLNHGSGKDV